MIDVTGCHFVVTVIGAPRRDIGHDLYTGNEFRVERGYGPVTVEWVGGDSPKMIDSGSVGFLPGSVRDKTSAFLAVPVPQTTAEHLAAAVLMKKPCGRELVDCLIEADTLDIDGEFAAKVRQSERERLLDILSRAQSDARLMEEDGGDPFVAEYIGDIMKAARENAA